MRAIGKSDGCLLRRASVAWGWMWRRKGRAARRLSRRELHKFDASAVGIIYVELPFSVATHLHVASRI
jgi:hypothetical protein